MESAIVVKNEVGKPKIKDKIKSWYVTNVANNGNTIKRLNDIRTTVENTAGAVALGIFFPAALPAVPAIQKGHKKANEFKYDTGKSLIHKGLGIKEEELDVKPVSQALDSLDDTVVENMTKDIAEKFIENQGGKSR